MRVLRLSFLRQYFLLTKNLKKALLIINIGIFLSIFAATSASISFYIEKKINEKEFLLITNQQVQRHLSNTSVVFASLTTLMDTLVNNETSRESTSSLFSMTYFGDKVLSNKDFYLPVIFTAKKEIEDYSDFLNEKISYEEDGVTKEADLYEFLLYFIQDWSEEEIKKFKAIIDNVKLTADEVEKINISIYEDAIFHSTYLDLLEEINNNNNNSISNYEHKIYKDYKTALDFNYAAIYFFRELQSVLGSGELAITDEIKKLNSEISDLSNLEKNVIFLAFILQFIIFIIIQFFEITSVHREINKKRKI